MAEISDITVQGSKLPSVLGGIGSFTIHAGTTSLGKPFTPGVDAVFDVDANTTIGKILTLGGAGSWKLSLKRAGLRIQAIWPTSLDAIQEYGLADHFAMHPDAVILMLIAGADAEGRAAAEFRYAPITASATLEAGAHATFTYARAYSSQTPSGTLIEMFLRDVRLPATLTGPVEDGEMIAFEYGGYLGVGAALGVGYELTGTPSFEIGQLRLSERYGVRLVGRVGVSGRLGGFFRVKMSPAFDASHRRMPGWTRVAVERNRTTRFAVAADASAEVKAQLRGLPDTPHEFLGAVLGVNVRNWLNLLDRVRAATDLNQLLAQCDELAIAFLTAWVDRQLAPGSLKELVAAANAFAKKYTSIDVTVMSAFERHHAAVAATDAGTHAALETLLGLRSWHELEGATDPGLWQLATELTGGDLLDWIADRPVDEMRRRAAEFADLENPSAHPALHRLVGLVNEQFGLRPLLTELANVKTVADLKAQAGKRLDGLIQRLLGDDIKRLQETDAGHALARIHAVLDHVDSFERAAYARITDAAQQAFLFDLHAEYSRASDNEALIDVFIDATGPAGVELLNAAAHGDCRALLESLPSDLVRLNKGRLTHRLTRTRTVGVNIIGWHAGWRYRGMERAILRADQQMAVDGHGGVTVHTTVDLTRNKDRRRAQERVATNFMMRFIGESRGAVQPDPDTLEYLIDTLTRMAATYDLSFQDDSTTLAELGYYLGFARDFGLAESARTDAVAAMLPLKGPDNFGPMTVTYDVRYQSDGLRKLFTQPLDEATIRRTIRKVTLASYVRAGGNLGRLGWAYWSSTTRKFFDTAQTKSFASMSAKEFFVVDSPFTGLPAPRYVVLQGTQLETLNTMYLIEDAFVRGLLALEALIGSGRKVSPRELEDRLGDISDALRLLDSFGESVNTVFAVFDALLTEVRGADRASSLKIQSEAAGKTVTKVFLASSGSLTAPTR